MIVYCVHNRINGKRYIGVTTMRLRARWTHHLSRSRAGVKTALYNAIRRYGEHAFEIEPIVSGLKGISVDDLFEIERAVIRQEGTKAPAGYNLTEGGEGTIGYRYTDEQKAAMKTRPPRTKEVIERVAAKQRGRKLNLSPEGLARKRESTRALHLGRKHTAETRRRMSEGHKGLLAGIPLSDEHRGKLSEAWTPERRAAQSAERARRYKAGLVQMPTRAGRSVSGDTRAKLRMAWTPERRQEQAKVMSERRKAALQKETAA